MWRAGWGLYLEVEYTIREIFSETNTIIKMLWFRGVGQRRKQPDHGSDNICDNIKIKLGFYSGLGKTIMKNMDVQVKRASVQRGEDPGALKTQEFIFLRDAAVEG